MMTYYIPLDKFRCKYALSAFSRRKNCHFVRRSSNNSTPAWNAALPSAFLTSASSNSTNAYPSPSEQIEKIVLKQLKEEAAWISMPLPYENPPAPKVLKPWSGGHSQTRGLSTVLEGLQKMCLKPAV